MFLNKQSFFVAIMNPHTRRERSEMLNAGHVSNQKENADDQTLENTKKPFLSNQQSEPKYIPTERTILRSKSANGLKVQSKENVLSNRITHHRKETKQNELLFGNANKARKVTKLPVSSLNTKEGKIKDKISNNENIQLQKQLKFKSPDTKSLQRSQSHSQLSEPLFKQNTLSRSSSVLESSSGFSTNSKLKGSLHSQLTLGANNNVAEFFKKTKEQERKQLGIPELELQSKTVENGTNDNVDMNITEVTFEEDMDDITTMKRISTLRDSPVFHRTHKVSLHSILSSSNDSDGIEETTFEYKENSKNPIDSKKDNLESLINRPFSSSKQSNDLEIEFVSHNNNGNYDDSIPDIVIEGAHQTLTSDVLANLWDEPTETSINAAKKFKDPLNLKNQWRDNNYNEYNYKNYKNSVKYKNLFEVKSCEIQKPDELQLELSEIKDESPKKPNPIEVVSTVDANDDIDNTSYDEEVLDLMDLYRH